MQFFGVCDMSNHEHNSLFYGSVEDQQNQMLPQEVNNPLYKLLQSENIKEFNARRAKGETVNLNGALLRGLDLRFMNAAGLDLGNAYMRGADLRGIDFRTANLEGASMAESKISGCYFPKELSPEEIRMSVEKGIRMRYR